MSWIVFSHGSYFLYADDLKFFTCCESQLIQQDLNALPQLSVLNCLFFHLSKCKILPFNFDRSQVLKLGQTALDYIDYIKDLGITISSKLSWQRQIDTNLDKCKKIFYFIKRNVPFTVWARNKLLLYQHLVLSILLFGCSVWQPCVIYMRKLQNFNQDSSDESFLIAIMFLHIRDLLSYHFSTRRFCQTWCCLRKWSIIKRRLRVKNKIVFSTQSHRLLDCLACLKRRSFAVTITILSWPADVQINC